MKNSIAIVALHEGYDLKLFVTSFSKFLNRSQTCQILSSQTICPSNSRVAQAEPNSIFERSLMQIIQYFKNEKNIIIYLADNDLTNWTMRSLNESDDVWVIGQHSDTTPLTPVAKKLIYQETNEKASLIVEFKSKMIEEVEIGHWLVPKNINRLYSMTKNNLTDFEELVALYLDKKKKISLVKAA